MVFFHADPHPGNLFVHPTVAQRREVPWQLAFVDFGMVGRISPETRQGLRELVIAVGTRDVARLTRAYQMLGLLLPDVDYSLLEKAELRLFERFWGKSMSELKEISVEELQEIAIEFRQLIYQMPFQVPNDLIFFARAVGILSGICTGLDPQFNLWQVLAPYAQELISAEAATPTFWLEQLGHQLQKWIDLPRRVQALLIQVERGELIIHDPQLNRQIRGLEIAVLRLSGLVVFAAMLLATVQFYLSERLTFAAAFGLTAFFVLVWAIWPRRPPSE